MPTPQSTNHYPRAIAMLMGTIIGVGIFGLPYVIAKSGVAIGIVHVVVLTLAILVVHLAFGELTLRTKEPHRLVGYARRYLGRWGWGIATVSTILGMYGALLAYLIVGGQFLHDLIGTATGFSPRMHSVIIGIGMLIAVGIGLRLIEELEFLLTAFLFIAMAIIFIVGAQRVDVANWMTVQTSSALLPYGAVLFALGGVSVIAEIREALRGRERLLPHAITWGTLLAALLTTCFVLTVVGVSGSATSPEAIAGL
ncbi:hypothetical protein HY480_00565, partial [Candidatus Uhrbacteria bacterium]|nr:hypothetical protein [Candidatus Uhrbacteria bacterium]